MEFIRGLLSRWDRNLIWLQRRNDKTHFVRWVCELWNEYFIEYKGFVDEYGMLLEEGSVWRWMKNRVCRGMD